MEKKFVKRSCIIKSSKIALVMEALTYQKKCVNKQCNDTQMQ